MTHWDMINKATKFEFPLCPSVSLALQFGYFVPRDRLAAKVPLLRSKKFDLKTNIWKKKYVKEITSFAVLRPSEALLPPLFSP